VEIRIIFSTLIVAEFICMHIAEVEDAYQMSTIWKSKEWEHLVDFFVFKDLAL